jgi:hypothetical protein
MLYIEIKNDIYKLHADTKRQMKLKHELLSNYPEYTEVRITDKGKEIEVLKLSDLFNEL